jgi:7-cyano-7-deazaguanine reductase
MPMMVEPPKPHDTAVLDTFENPNPQRDYEIRFTCPEFTCICPKTGQPDFATIRIRYVPDQRCVELKSLKLYLWSFRSVGAFHEKITNSICDDLVGLMAPRYLEVEAEFLVRGGIYTTVVCRHGERPAALR